MDFKVKHYLELKETDRVDSEAFNVNPTQPLGVRDLALLASTLPGFFKGSVAELDKKIKKIPLSGLKNLIKEKFDEHILPLKEEMSEAQKKEFSDEEFKEGVMSLIDGRIFAIPFNIGANKIFIIPRTEKSIPESTYYDRFQAVKHHIFKVNNDIMTPEGVDNFIKEMSYLDFEKLYMANITLDERLMGVNWSELLKNS